jgi:hypothetical protein
MPFAVGQLAVFQGASEAPISESYGSTRRGEGNGQLAAVRRLPDRSRIGSEMLPPGALTLQAVVVRSHSLYTCAFYGALLRGLDCG